MIKVSVIVPIYNAEQYLVQCLDSIMNQTLKDIEIILINDGSTDSSAEICQRYSNDSRVIYYVKENEGLAAARQDGMDRARGEYIGFVDSDDWIEPEMYEKMYVAAKTNDADVVFCNCIENENGHRFTPEMRSGAYDRTQILTDVLPRTLAYISDKGEKRAIRWCNWLRIYKKELLDEHDIRFDRRFRRSQDLQLTYEAMLAAKRFYYLGDDYLYHNRVVADSLSRGYTKNMWSLYIPLIERLYRDTEHFTESDLMPKMHLRCFFFVVNCIENELKSSFPYEEEKRVELINEIIRHPLCDRYYGKIEIEIMQPLYQKYYELIHQKDAGGIIRYTRAYQKKQKRKQKYFVPFAHFVTEGPIIGKVYKMLFNKQ